MVLLLVCWGIDEGLLHIVVYWHTVQCCKLHLTVMDVMHHISLRLRHSVTLTSGMVCNVTIWHQLDVETSETHRSLMEGLTFCMMEIYRVLCISEASIKCKVTPGTYSLYTKVYSLLQTFTILQNNYTMQHNTISQYNTRQQYNTMQNKVTILYKIIISGKHL